VQEINMQQVLPATLLSEIHSSASSSSHPLTMQERALQRRLLRERGSHASVSPRRHGTGTIVIEHTSSRPNVAIKATCGDGLITGTEQCDDGNTVSGDGCSSSCQIETGFQCVSTQPSHCWSTCGDGVKTPNEKCDDGNLTNGDGCTSACTVEMGYICTGSPSKCAPPAICGDGIVSGSEQCDDGNSHNGDGCTNTCTIETGYTCSGHPSVCVKQ
jgi:cysteine-rich repeat protein